MEVSCSSQLYPISVLEIVASILYPFYPSQNLLDQKASLSLAACLTRMGGAVQLISRDSHPHGFFLEISSFEEPSKEWLNEWFRQASLFMKQEWSKPVEMTSENLKLFWKQKGQYLRARELNSSCLLSVVCQQGLLEPCDISEKALQAMAFDSLMFLKLEAGKKQIKGHREKIWIVHGKTAPTSEARKVLSKSKPSQGVLSPKGLVLKPSQMQKLLHVQSLWLEVLDEQASSIVCCGGQKLQPAEQKLNEGFCWQKSIETGSLGYVPLWLESEFDSVFWNQTASGERVSVSLSFLLRRISKIVRILKLEVSCSLRVSSHPAMRSWLDLFEVESFSSVSKIEEEESCEKPQLVWQMSVLHDRSWWPLAELSLHALDSTKWRLEAKPVISFYRWAAAIGAEAHQ